MVNSIGEMRMKQAHMVYAILVFGLITAITVPHLTAMAYENDVTYETTNKEELASTNETVNSTAKIANSASNMDVAIATPSVKEKAPEAPAAKPVQQVSAPQVQNTNPIVYDGLTMEQLVNKLNKSLRSNLAGTGNLYANYALQNGVDPYLAVAITLHETGCKWSCNSAVKNHNNVGGMRSGGSLIHFDSLEAGIKAFIVNLKENYYDKGLNTPELMNKKYAASPSWAAKINNYINQIKNS